MRLKVFTTSLMVLGMIMLATWPWVIGPKPSDPQDLRIYTIRFGIYLMAMVVIFATIGFCAVLIAKRAREEYREQMRENIESLIEGALRDQQRRPTEGMHEP